MNEREFSECLRELRTQGSKPTAEFIFTLLHPGLAGSFPTRSQWKRIPKKSLLVAIAYYEKTRNYIEAAEIAEEAKMPRVAILNLVRGDCSDRAKELAARTGQTSYLRRVCREHIDFHLHRSATYRVRGRFLPAADVAEIAGRYDLAFQYLMRSKHPPSTDRAMELARQYGVQRLMRQAKRHGLESTVKSLQ